MSFVAKHLPDKFYLKGARHKSLWTKILREVVANLILRREYTIAHPCTFVITSVDVQTGNADSLHGEGPTDLQTFAPFPRIRPLPNFSSSWEGWMSLSLLNVNKYISSYAGGEKPQFIEVHLNMMRGNNYEPPQIFFPYSLPFCSLQKFAR